MDSRIEVAILLILFFFPSVGKVAYFRLRTGKTPIAFGLRSTSADRFIGASFLFMLASYFLLGALYLAYPPIIESAGPYDALETALVKEIGFILGLASFGIVGWAQFAMGESWRIGIDREAPTKLVLHGPFRWIRNPIYTGMIGAVFGVFFLIPCQATLFLAFLTAYALNLQVRLEEDHLINLHGDEYKAYFDRTGRFLPRVSP